MFGARDDTILAQRMGESGAALEFCVVSLTFSCFSPFYKAWRGRKSQRNVKETGKRAGKDMNYCVIGKKRVILQPQTKQGEQ